MNTWILVADPGSARVFRQEAAILTLVEKFEHPASRHPQHERVSDRPGRVQQGNRGRRSSLEPHTPLEEQAAQEFAVQLSHSLEESLKHRHFDELIVAAPPHFLGLLRKKFSPHLTKHVVREFNKDLVQFDARDLLKHLA